MKRILMLLVLGGFGVAAHTQTVIVSADELTQLTVPVGWTKVSDLNENASIQAKNVTTQGFVVIITDSRADYYGWNLEKHSRGTTGKLIADISFPEVEGPRKITINEFPGHQYDITGITKDFKVHYLHTTLETPKQYLQILMWSGQSAYEKNKADFEAMVKSIKEAK